MGSIVKVCPGFITPTPLFSEKKLKKLLYFIIKVLYKSYYKHYVTLHFIILHYIIWLLYIHFSMWNTSGFVLLKLQKIPWFSMTFSMSFSSLPWLIFHNSVKYIQWNFCLSWYTMKIESYFFIVIKFSMTFHNSTQNSMTFQAWKAKKKKKKFHDFPGLES